MVTVKVLLVIGIIMLFICILLVLTVTTYVHYTDDLLVKVRYGFFQIQILPLKERKKKTKRKKKKEHTSAKNQKIRRENAKEGVSLVRSAVEPLQQMFSHVKVDSVQVYILVGGEDAAKTAINYAKVNGAVYSILAAAQNFVPISVKQIRIQCDFLREDSKYNIRLKVKIRAYHIIYTACRILLRYIGNTLKTEKRTVHKKAEV